MKRRSADEDGLTFHPREDGSAEIRDSEGKLTGFFGPAGVEAAGKTDWAEIERRKQSTEEGVPFEVIRERLRLLEAEIERRRVAGEKDMTPEEAVRFIQHLREQDDPG